MRITFTYFVITPESVELGIFLDHGAFDPVSNQHYSILDVEYTPKYYVIAKNTHSAKVWMMLSNMQKK